MLFKIDLVSAKPVYQQIADQVKHAVATGRLREGDRMETIRDAAVQARVNRNTVARAYLELEREGIIRSKPGQGTFIATAGDANVGRARARKIVVEAIDDALMRAHQFRLTKDETAELIRERMARFKLDED